MFDLFRSVPILFEQGRGFRWDTHESAYGTEQTCRQHALRSAHGGKAELNADMPLGLSLTQSGHSDLDSRIRCQTVNPQAVHQHSFDNGFPWCDDPAEGKSLLSVDAWRSAVVRITWSAELPADFDLNHL